jgi:peptide/nickel transport system substrate-binding protein
MSRPRTIASRLLPGVLALLVMAAALRACGDPVVVPAPAPAAAPAGDDVTREWAEKRAQELGGGVRPEDVMGPHPIEPDLFHPDRRPTRPALGGRIVVHIESFPASLNKALNNAAIVTWMLSELHDTLLQFNMETRRNEPSLARAMWVEDQLPLADGGVLVGDVSEDGDAWRVRAASPHNPQAERRVPTSEAREVLRDTVYTFDLQPGVTWHDGHPFDAQDVLFSWRIYGNPAVDCDEARYQFEEIVKGEVLGPLSVRFTLRGPYFKSESLFTDSLFLLPRHLYDLTDPDCPDHDPDATDEECAAYVNANPHNQQFVGLGPYRLAAWEQGQQITGERYAGYWQTDPARTGYLDTIVWKFVQGDDAAFLAVLNDEIDLFRRLKTEDYFGESTRQPAFADDYYKAYVYTSQYSYTCWNTHRDKFKDVRVRTALAHAFDSRGWVQTKYQGLAVPVTGPAFFLSPFYDQDVPLLEHDPERAEALLAEAGFYDRDGDGVVDRDGEPLAIEFLMPAGNKASEAFGQKLQDSFARVGVKVTLSAVEFAMFQERMRSRDFDCFNLAWIMYEPESDPKQTWHGSGAAFEKRGSNHHGLADPEIDRLIDTLRVEPVLERRIPLWHALHRRIYELQPYLFGQTPPAKFAIAKRLRGVKLYTTSPGYRIRDMYLEEGTPGTRPLPGR